MLHDDDRLLGVVILRPEAFQHERPIGIVAVRVRKARATGSIQRSRKLVRAHRGASRKSAKSISTRTLRKVVCRRNQSFRSAYPEAIAGTAPLAGTPVSAATRPLSLRVPIGLAMLANRGTGKRAENENVSSLSPVGLAFYML